MKDILFYGGGNIAQSVIEGLIKSGYPKNNIFYNCFNNIIRRIIFSRMLYV